MSDLAMSRRAVTRAIAILPAIAATPGIAASTNDPDAAIKAAWEQRCKAYRTYNELPWSDELGEETPEEQAQWAIIEETEDVIRSTLAKTLEGVEIQLWIGAQRADASSALENAALDRDLPALERSDAAEKRSVEFLVAALRSLRSMGGVA